VSHPRRGRKARRRRAHISRPGPHVAGPAVVVILMARLGALSAFGSPGWRSGELARQSRYPNGCYWKGCPGGASAAATEQRQSASRGPRFRPKIPARRTCRGITTYRGKAVANNLSPEDLRYHRPGPDELPAAVRPVIFRPAYERRLLASISLTSCSYWRAISSRRLRASAKVSSSPIARTAPLVRGNAGGA
jgi:hypothetical protein